MIKYADEGNKHNQKFLNLKRRKCGGGGGGCLANIQYICGKIYIINSYIVIHSKPALTIESWDRLLQHHKLGGVEIVKEKNKESEPNEVNLKVSGKT